MTPAAAGSSQPAPNRLGTAVLGGSFNPPHLAHLRLAAAALRQLPIDQVLVIPAGDHPHKDSRSMAPAVHRLAMCRLAFAGQPGIVVDDRELRRDGPSFTVDTLAALHAEDPDRPLYFLIGSDNLPLLPSWRDHHRLLALATVVTYPRAGCPVQLDRLAALDLTPGESEALLRNVLDLPACDIAASNLRERWQRGERDLPEVAATVRRYIEDHRLYG